jgi:hypothetical protein
MRHLIFYLRWKRKKSWTQNMLTTVVPIYSLTERAMFAPACSGESPN